MSRAPAWVQQSPLAYSRGCYFVASRGRAKSGGFSSCGVCRGFVSRHSRFAHCRSRRPRARAYSVIRAWRSKPPRCARCGSVEALSSAAGVHHVSTPTRGPGSGAASMSESAHGSARSLLRPASRACAPVSESGLPATDRVHKYFDFSCRLSLVAPTLAEICGGVPGASSATAVQPG